MCGGCVGLPWNGESCMGVEGGEVVDGGVVVLGKNHQRG